MIQLTSITQPPQGAVIAMRCEQCQKITFVLSEHAVKPRDGDYWFFIGICEENFLHNFMPFARSYAR